MLRFLKHLFDFAKRTFSNQRGIFGIDDIALALGAATLGGGAAAGATLWGNQPRAVNTAPMIEAAKIPSFHSLGGGKKMEELINQPNWLQMAGVEGLPEAIKSAYRQNTMADLNEQILPSYLESTSARGIPRSTITDTAMLKARQGASRDIATQAAEFDVQNYLTRMQELARRQEYLAKYAEMERLQEIAHAQNLTGAYANALPYEQNYNLAMQQQIPQAIGVGLNTAGSLLGLGGDLNSLIGETKPFSGYGAFDYYKDFPELMDMSDEDLLDELLTGQGGRYAYGTAGW